MRMVKVRVVRRAVVCGAAFPAVLLSALLGMTACGSDSDSGSSSAKKVTITLLHNTPQKAAYNGQIADFERANPNIDVRATYADPTVLYPLVATQLQAGNAADLLFATFGAASPVPIVKLATEGKILPLDGSPWIERIPERMRPLVTQNGHVYAPVLQASPIFVYYRPDLFSKAGVSVPKTFPQLLEACQAFDKAGILPISHAGGAAIHNLLVAFGLSANWVTGPDPTYNTRRVKKEITFASAPQWKTALQKVVDMKNAKCFSPGVAGVTTVESGTAGFVGNPGAAMDFGQASNYSQLPAANPKLKYGAFTFPGDTESKTWTTYTAGNTVVVNKASSPEKQKAARTFIDFMMQPKQNEAFTKLNGTISTTDLVEGVVPDFLKPLAPNLTADKLRAEPYIEGGNWPSTEISLGALGGGMTGLFTGQKTVDDVLKDMDAAWK